MPAAQLDEKFASSLLRLRLSDRLGHRNAMLSGQVERLSAAGERIASRSIAACLAASIAMLRRTSQLLNEPALTMLSIMRRC